TSLSLGKNAAWHVSERRDSSNIYIDASVQKFAEQSNFSNVVSVRLGALTLGAEGDPLIPFRLRSQTANGSFHCFDRARVFACRMFQEWCLAHRNIFALRGFCVRSAWLRAGLRRAEEIIFHRTRHLLLSSLCSPRSRAGLFSVAPCGARWRSTRKQFLT